MRQLLNPGDLPAGARVLLDRGGIDLALAHMSNEVMALRWPKGPQGPAPWLCGVQRGGVVIAHKLAELLANQHGIAAAVGSVDITLYRDDTWMKGPHAVEGVTRLPGDPTGQRVLLVDDVLFTGRTVRAALNVLMDFGRPEAVKLCVLVDRGGRELPVAADVTGAKLGMVKGETAELCVDGDNKLLSVIVLPNPQNRAQ